MQDSTSVITREQIPRIVGKKASITVRQPCSPRAPLAFSRHRLPRAPDLHHFHPRMYDFQGEPDSFREASGSPLGIMLG